jgi:N6-L-threonylcarbamoyladenine synthase
MLVLGIESSCDETAAAVLEDGLTIRSNCVASQIEIHKKYGGVVPELASRHHLENIVPIVSAALGEAEIKKEDIDGIAVTQGPGLVGSLLVGVNYAKALSYCLGRPLVAVNHIEGHIYSVPLQISCDERNNQVPHTGWDTLFPALALVVSGGHTSLFWVKHIHRRVEEGSPYQLVGRTRDDAAGEAFDKVAKLLQLGYPGGPIVDELAKRGDPLAVEFPVTRMSDSTLDFSFSGIKTAVLRYVRANLSAEMEMLCARRNMEDFPDSLPQVIYDVIASFQKTAVENLFDNTMRAAEVYEPRSIMVSGGVACNTYLRSRFQEGFGKRSLPVYFPSPLLSTDNAAMIAAAGYPKLKRGELSDLTLNADVNLKMG